MMIECAISLRWEYVVDDDGDDGVDDDDAQIWPELIGDMGGLNI